MPSKSSGGSRGRSAATGRFAPPTPTFVYYENNRIDARREVPIADLVTGFAASKWAGDDYDGWPLERRVDAYLGQDVHASYDARDPEFTAGCEALLDAIRNRP